MKISKREAVIKGFDLLKREMKKFRNLNYQQKFFLFAHVFLELEYLK